MAVGFHNRRQQDAMAQPMRSGMQSITPGTGTPFLWGGGGRRVAHGDLDLERQLAAQQLATGASFAPVAHWSQGLARVANALAGRVGMDRADDKAAQRLEAEQALKAEQQARNEAVIRALLPDKPELAAALANPGTADVAQALLPKPSAPTIQRQNNGDIIGLDPQTGDVLFSRADPNPKPVINWQMVTDPVTKAVTYVPFGPNGPMTGGAPQSLGSELPEGWKIDEGGGVSDGTGGF